MVTFATQCCSGLPAVVIFRPVVVVGDKIKPVISLGLDEPPRLSCTIAVAFLFRCRLFDCL